MIETVKCFRSNIKITFGLDRCIVINVREGEVENQQGKYKDIEILQPEEASKYLGIPQNQQINRSCFKIFTEKYRKRVTKILNTKLSAKNQITVLNMWAVIVLTYSFGIIRWTSSVPEGLDKLTRRLLSKFLCHHPISSVIRLYLPRKGGGQG